ncbi:hypothetical protein J2I47_12170 [Fibrella sp. HMF5335]|uniref:YD repeat-containing protein n=1 Tax=Fibrella rubiginis TaxID=2817060 RepID=A0A939GHI7_9BACT|nr:hypothetical protein [Fibrella rubiginis]MBO0937304.1 hypothetical protein [Fibrella rubiginis]
MKLLSFSGLLKLGAFVLLAWLPAGCSLIDHRTLPVVPSNCRLTSQNNMMLTYTTDGLLTSYGDDRYTYNAEGFVLTRLTYDRITASPYIRHTYQYNQGRLIGDIEYRYATDRDLITQTYEYDNSGQLTRLFYRVNGGALYYTSTYLFSGGKQTDFIQYDGNSGVQTQPYRFENGLIKQVINQSTAGTPTSVTEYTYNAAGQLLSTANETTGIYHTYEYIDGHPASAAVPAFKGWPVLSLNATSLNTTSLPAKDIEYRKDAAGVRYKYGETIHTYTMTASGYPLSDQVNYVTYNATGQVTNQGSLSKTTYTYDNCN